MQKLIAGVLAAASVAGAVSVAALPTAATAQPYYGYHHRYWRHHFYCGWRCRHHRYWRHHFYRY